MTPTAPNEVDCKTEEREGTAAEAEAKEPKEEGDTPAGDTEPLRFRYQLPPLTLRQTWRLQQSPNFVIERMAFQRVIREITQSLGGHEISYQSMALEALQCVAEEYLTELFQQAERAAIHAGRETVEPEDIKLVLLLRGEQLRGP